MDIEARHGVQLHNNQLNIHRFFSLNINDATVLPWSIVS